MLKQVLMQSFIQEILYEWPQSQPLATSYLGKTLASKQNCSTKENFLQNQFNQVIDNLKQAGDKHLNSKDMMLLKQLEHALNTPSLLEDFYPRKKELMILIDKIKKSQKAAIHQNMPEKMITATISCAFKTEKFLTHPSLPLELDEIGSGNQDQKNQNLALIILAKEIFIRHRFIDLSGVLESTASLPDLADSIREWMKKNQASLDQVLHLNLARSNMQVLPKEIELLTQLRVLDLERNKLKTIQKELLKLSKLEELNLSYNQLDFIPKGLENLTQLKVLYLDNNQLKAIPEELGNLTLLKVLHLGNNQLDFIPKELGNLAKLEVLFLANNKLKVIPKEFGNLAKLREVYLWGNQLEHFPEELRNLAQLEEFLF